MRSDVLLLDVGGPSGAGKSTVCRLLAEGFERSVVLSADEFGKFVVSGWVDQWRPEAAMLNEALGSSLGAAAVQFAAGGFTTMVDGHGFPDGFEGLARVASMYGVPAHFVVLRADYATCRARAVARGPVPQDELMRGVWERYQGLGPYEQNVVDASGSPQEVAELVLEALDAGTLAWAEA